MNRTRILIVLPTLGPGGAERVTSLLASSWVHRGHDVRILAWGHEENPAFVPDPNVEITTLNLVRPSRGIVDGLLSTRERLRAITREIDAWHPTIVLGMTTHAGILSTLAASRRHLPSIIAERNFPPHRSIGFVWETLRRKAYRRARCVVMQTERAAGWARAVADCQVRVIANPIASAFLAPLNDEAREQRIVVVGRLVDTKRPGVALAAFAEVAGRHLEWNLDFVGDGPLRPALEAEVRRLGLTRRVRFLGVVAGVPELLRAASIVLFTSASEGFPNAVLEAIASGCAVVSTDCEAGPAEILTGGCGVLVPVGDVPRTAHALQLLLDDPGERTRLGRKARQRAEGYSIDRIVEQWRPLIEANTDDHP